MGKIDVGVITIGQSPRVDLTEDIKDIISDNINLVEMGALDNFTIEYVRENLAPDKGDTVLVSRMRDGKQVILSEEKIIPLLQKCIYDLEERGCGIIILLCTGKFPEFAHNKPLIYPQKLVHKVVEELLEEKTLGIILPNIDQVDRLKNYWESKNVKTKIAVASPYLPIDKLNEVYKEFDDSVSIILMDCMGYSSFMRSIVSKSSNKIVIVPRNLVFTIVNEIL